MERKARNKAGQIGLMDQMYNQMGENAVPRVHGVKRAGENINASKANTKKTRKAFGDITNRAKSQNEGGKKATKPASKLQTKTKTKKTEKLISVAIPRTVTGSLTNSQQDRNDTSWDVIEVSQLSQPSSQLGSQPSSSQSSLNSIDSGNSSNKPLEVSVHEMAIKDKDEEPAWEDIDAKETDEFQVSHYAAAIFRYYQTREKVMMVEDYMPNQKDLSLSMRAILVDWLVEVQENFELNHETLYLAVKLVDKYLVHNPMTRDTLQLVGSTAMFLACKFDERMPPVLDDFIYICDDAYSREELLDMEWKLFKAVDFDLGFPLSYSFLRRFAKCGKSQLGTLTLARFVLEFSLMEYEFVTEYDSMMAAACLFLATAMRDPEHKVDWNATLEHYTNYKAADLLPLVRRLNDMIAAPPTKSLATIRTKYSHRVFLEVAKIPTLTSEALDKFEES